MTTRRGRGERRAGRTVVLTDRDVELLTLVGLCRHIGVDQLARALFPSPDRCRQRCRELFDAEYLAVTLVSSTSPNLVSLGRAGLTAIKEHRPELGDTLKLPGMLRLAAVAHHRAVVDVRLYAHALGVSRGMPLTRWGGPQGDLARELGLSEKHIEADGLAEFATEDGPVVMAVEVDRGTESLTVIEHKLDRYAELATEGTVDALWIVVAAGLGRERTLQALLDSHGLDAWARVLSHNHVVRRPVEELPERGQGSGLKPEYGVKSCRDPLVRRAGWRGTLPR